MSTETKRRRLEACGRLLGLSIRNAIPLGVVMPAAIWAELMSDTPPEDPSPAPELPEQLQQPSAQGISPTPSSEEGEEQQSHADP